MVLRGAKTLILSEMHGDEYQWSVLIYALMRIVNTDLFIGRLTLLPVLNLSTFTAGTRLTSDNCLNLNHVFPDETSSSLTQQIADWLSENTDATV